MLITFFTQVKRFDAKNELKIDVKKVRYLIGDET